MNANNYWLTREAGQAPEVPSHQVVEYQLVGDLETIHRGQAGRLNWSDMRADDGQGSIYRWRPVVSEHARRHGHYFKDVSGLGEIDVYRVLALFDVRDQAIGHAVKKLLVPGRRGAGKTIEQDVQEAVDTLIRWLEMRAEDARRAA